MPNDNPKMGSMGLDPKEVDRFQQGFNGALGSSALSNAPQPVAHPPEQRGVMGGLSNQDYPRKVRITTK